MKRHKNGLQRVVGFPQERYGPLDRPSGTGEAALVYGQLGPSPVDRRPQAVDREIGELLGDRLEPGTDLVELPSHQPPAPIAASTSSSGWRTSTPAAARCMTQPGFALATTAAPDRSIASSFRSRIALARVGSSAA